MNITKIKLLIKDWESYKELTNSKDRLDEIDSNIKELKKEIKIKKQTKLT